MKKFLGIVVLGLLLITPSQADDIRDFQIEGMSVGDSLYEIYNKKEIKKFKKIYPSYKFQFLEIPYAKIKSRKSHFKFYDYVEVALRKNDKKYKIIMGIYGLKDYEDINKCFAKMGSIVEELSKISLIRSKKNTYNYNLDGHEINLTEVIFGGHRKVIDSYHSRVDDSIRVGCLENKTTRSKYLQIRIFLKHIQ